MQAFGLLLADASCPGDISAKAFYNDFSEREKIP